MTFEEGIPLSKVINGSVEGSVTQALKHELGRTGLKAFVKMLFVDNFVHCDCHPGNILYTYPRGVFARTVLVWCLCVFLYCVSVASVWYLYGVCDVCSV
jgi:predicted unusual protein kinase regulating ubiquinone biosynthesis (AarF/ABC1/UbiB family)